MEQMNTTSNRLEYLDIAKAFAIILVILGHCCVRFDENGLGMIVNPWLKIVYSFHMPLFFLAAGITSHPQAEYTKERWIKTFRKNFDTLLVPYIIFCLIYIPFSWENILRMLYGTTQSVRASGQPCTQLWFLPCLFVARSMMYGVLHISTKVPRGKWFCFFAAVASFAVGFALPKFKYGYPLGCNIALIALGFMIVGYLIGDKFRMLSEKSLWLQLGVVLLSAIGLYFGNVYGTDPDKYAGMYVANYGPVFWFLLNAFLGIILARALASVITKINSDSFFAFVKNGLLWLGKNTIGIFLLHMPINLLYIIPWMEKSFNMQRGNLGDSCLMTLVTLAICIVTTLVINRTMPQIFGKR